MRHTFVHELSIVLQLNYLDHAQGQMKHVRVHPETTVLMRQSEKMILGLNKVDHLVTARCIAESEAIS